MSDIISENVETLQVRTAVNGYGWISFTSGRSMTNQAMAPTSCTKTMPVGDGIECGKSA